jgi:hypothetical protein
MIGRPDRKYKGHRLHVLEILPPSLQSNGTHDAAQHEYDVTRYRRSSAELGLILPLPVDFIRGRYCSRGVHASLGT